MRCCYLFPVDEMWIWDKLKEGKLIVSSLPFCSRCHPDLFDELFEGIINPNVVQDCCKKHSWVQKEWIIPKMSEEGDSIDNYAHAEIDIVYEDT